MKRTAAALLALVLALPCARAGTPADVPGHVDEFIAYCRTNSPGCDRYLRQADLALLAAPRDWPGYCGPKKFTPATRAKILRWLAHTYPETFHGSTDIGVRAALRTLYQCHRPQSRARQRH